MSSCSYSKKSVKDSEYGGSINGGFSKNRDVIRGSNFSDISSIAE